MAIRSMTTAALATGLLVFCGTYFTGAGDGPKAGLSNGKPLTPREERATFRIVDGFTIELAASEPNVVDPVALAFDERGRLFVAEMRAYPNEGVGTGKIDSGQIRLLEDRDNDGFFERSTVFADKLRLPTSVMPYKGGLLVANAPELLYFKDTNGDGKSDEKRVLYTGFDLSNIQQMLNSLQWGLDNWIYGCAGYRGGSIRSAEKPSKKTLVLRGRGVRFHPDRPGSLEAASGGGQYGLAANDWQQWFTATNSQHLRQIVLPDHYLRRNPLLPVRSVTVNIPDHGAACKVHRISPFEAWRVERTTRRKTGPRASRFSPTELVPGGFITSACSPLMYLANLFPKECYGQVFVCDPANNLIHRDRLDENGAVFIARRIDEKCEFLASTHNFFRPVHLALGPDGAIYVADFYREVIETPRSLPDDIKKRVNLQSRNRGRIWRIRPQGKYHPQKVNLRDAAAADLVQGLAKRNMWRRRTCQRLLVERQDKTAVEALRNLLHEADFPPARAHALWTLHGLQSLTDADVLFALRDESAGVRAQALRVAEDRLGTTGKIRRGVCALASDPSYRVRFQLAFSLGEAPSPESAQALWKILQRDGGDSWMRTAVLSSTHGEMVNKLLAAVRNRRKDPKTAKSELQLVSQIVALAAAAPGDKNLPEVLRLLGDNGKAAEMPWRLAVLDGLAQGLQRKNIPIARLWQKPPASLREDVGKLLPLFSAAGKSAANGKLPLAQRVDAVRMLGFAPYATASATLEKLLNPLQPQSLQIEIVRALAEHSQPRIGEILLKRWNAYSPAVRSEAVAALFARADRLEKLLTALESKKVNPTQLEPSRLALLHKHPNPRIRNRAAKVLSQLTAPARTKVIAKYQKALDLKPNIAKGKALFKKNCAVCHRLENVGFETGADLTAALPGKSPKTILLAILDPNREVDPRYLEYIVTTKTGKILNGRIMTETAGSITLRRDQNVEHVVLRRQIASLVTTSRSLMPEGLEKKLSLRDVADLIGYLQYAVRKKE